MIRTWPHRIHIERRLLAALFLWPAHIAQANLDSHSFQSLEHGILFDAFTEVGDALQSDLRAIPLVVAAVKKLRKLGVFKHVNGVEEYIMTRLVPMPVQRSEIPALIEQVRECPRCGK